MFNIFITKAKKSTDPPANLTVSQAKVWALVLLNESLGITDKHPEWYILFLFTHRHQTANIIKLWQPKHSRLSMI